LLNWLLRQTDRRRGKTTGRLLLCPPNKKSALIDAAQVVQIGCLLLCCYRAVESQSLCIVLRNTPSLIAALSTHLLPEAAVHGCVLALSAVARIDLKRSWA